MTWLSRLLGRRRMEEQLEKELRFHIDQHVADLTRQGLSPEEARRKANQAIGGPEQVKEDCRDARGTRWVEDLIQDSHYAIRTLLQRPGFTIVALLTLALGTGATTVMFTVLYSVLLKPLSYPEPEKLVAIQSQVENLGDLWGFSHPDFQDYKSQIRSLSLTAWSYSGGTISKPGEPEYEDGRQIAAGLFSILGIPLELGREFLPSEDRAGAAPVAIISHNIWQTRFAGSPAAIGASLSYDGKSYTIVGIAPAGFLLEGDVDVLTPLSQTTDARIQNRMARFLHMEGRLQPGATLDTARAELSLTAQDLARQYPRTNSGIRPAPHPFQEEMVGDVGSMLWLLLGAVSLVLLIACANVASLQLARAVSRERELSLRVALGAGRGRLLRQCLTEGAVLGLSGGLLGVLVAALGVRPFVLLWPGSLPRESEIHVDAHVLLFALAASLLSGILFGLAPAMRTSARSLEQALRTGARTQAGVSRRLHGGFVISEIALAMVLLISAGILGRVLLRVSQLDPGLDTHNVLTARIAIAPESLSTPAQTRAAWRDFLDHARHIPGVQSVAFADIIPMRTGENTLNYSTSAIAPPQNKSPIALASSVTNDYLDVMRLPLLRGRFFTEQDRLESTPVIVIDESLARPPSERRTRSARGFGFPRWAKNPFWLSA